MPMLEHPHRDPTAPDPGPPGAHPDQLTTAECGMAVSGPDTPEIVLTVEDVARIAAAEADIHD